jgi:hypothetical protein
MFSKGSHCYQSNARPALLSRKLALGTKHKDVFDAILGLRLFA